MLLLLQRFVIHYGHITSPFIFAKMDIMKKLLCGSLVVLVLFSSCLKSHDTPQVNCNSSYDACAVKASATEVDSVEAYLASKGITDAVKHCSGMYYKIDSVGTGKTPTICSIIGVTYTGQLKNGTVFDQQTSNPVAFYLSRLIAGFKNGIPLIREGGSIHLYVPPSLGYGSQQNGAIPPNSLLIFQVSLIGVQ
jgi:FKBP-type peptidyl-prolyl cis-trans isomerase FkpA